MLRLCPRGNRILFNNNYPATLHRHFAGAAKRDVQPGESNKLDARYGQNMLRFCPRGDRLVFRNKLKFSPAFFKRRWGNGAKPRFALRKGRNPNQNKAQEG